MFKRPASGSERYYTAFSNVIQYLKEQSIIEELEQG